jgi:hypothetical protein
MQKLVYKDAGAKGLQGLLSKDNPAMLAREEPMDEAELTRREAVIESYEKTITILRQKKETFMVAQAC